MSEQMQQCQNCLKWFPQSKIPTHFGYCRRNIKKCQKCGEMYDINFQEEHQEEFHKTVPCSHCKINLHPSDLSKHQSQCPKKPKFCQYCQLQVPVQEFASHLRACQSRTKQCEKCRKPISNKDFLVHLTTCRGIIEQPKPQKNYNDFLREQRNQIKKEQSKREYTGIVQKPKIIERRQYQYRPRQETKRPQIKKQTKNQYKNQYKPEKYQNYKYREGPNSYTNNHHIYSKPIGLKKNIDTKIQVKQNQVRQNQVKQSQVSKNQVQKPIRKQIFPRHIPTTTATYSNKYVRQVPQLQPRIVQKKVIQHTKVVKHPVIQKKVQKKRWEQEYKNDINPTINNGMIDEDEQLQRAIFESMGQMMPQKSNKIIQKKIPKQFMSEDMMNQSFYGDLDMEKQMAMIREIQQKNRR